MTEYAESDRKNAARKLAADNKLKLNLISTYKKDLRTESDKNH